MARHHSLACTSSGIVFKVYIDSYIKNRTVVEKSGWYALKIINTHPEEHPGEDVSTMVNKEIESHFSLAYDYK